MERPKDEDFRNNESGTITYLFALEKYCDALTKENEELRKDKKKNSELWLEETELTDQLKVRVKELEWENDKLIKITNKLLTPKN